MFYRYLDERYSRLCTFYLPPYLLDLTTEAPVKHCDITCKRGSYCDSFSWRLLQNRKCLYD